MELSKVIEMCLHHGILLSLKDSSSTPNVWESPSPVTPLREGERGSQRGPTKGLVRELTIHLNAFEMLIFFCHLSLTLFK